MSEKRSIIKDTYKRGFDGAIISGEIDVKNRTVGLSFSSEKPVKRWFGNEVLLHNSENADFSRLNNGAAVLVDHGGDQVGVVEKAEIRNKKGYAVLRFSKSQRGEEVFQDVIDGIRKNVSFGYEIKEYEEEKRDKEIFINVNRWSAFEISLVSIPADETIGIGRSLEKENTGEVEQLEAKSEDKGLSNAESLKERDAEESDATEAVNIKEKTENKNKRNLIMADEKIEVRDDSKRIKEIFAISDKHPELVKDAQEAITSGRSFEDFSRIAMDKLFKKQESDIQAAQNVNNLDLSKKEKRNYSIMNGIRGIISGKRDGLEFEVSREIAKRMGKDPQGFYLYNQRDLNVTTPSAGGYSVATDLMSDNFIDLLRNKMSIMSAGATMMTGLKGDISIPKQTGAATKYWVSEGSAITESQQTLGQVSMSPKTVGAYTDYTRKFMLQSSIDAEQFVRNDLANVLALAIDAAAINGSGVGAEPTGLLQAGITSVALGTNGAAPTFAKVVKLKSTVDASNALAQNMKFITNAGAMGTLQTTEKSSGTAQYIAGENNKIIGYDAIVSEQCPSNLTKGSGTSLSALIFGNFADVIIGMWSALDINVDPYALATSGGVRIIALQDVDVALRRTESFAAIVDMITT